MSARDHPRGYRHPFVFGVHYLGGIGGIFPKDGMHYLVELAMCQYSAELRRTPEWWALFQNQDVREEWARWGCERVWKVRTPSEVRDVQLSAKQVDYVLDELAGYAALRDPENRCQPSCFERIWEAEDLIDASELNERLSELNERLSELQAETPRATSGTTAHLIDPTLYPLIYNRTLVFHPHTTPHLRPVPPPTHPSPFPTPSDIYTTSFISALLPSPVALSPKGTATFTSYINNLHPIDHFPLYTHLQTLLTAFIPLFEHTLTDLHRNNPLPQRIPGACRYKVWDEPEEPEFSDDEEGWAAYEREVREWVMHRPIELPDVPVGGYPGGLERRKHVVSLRGREVQVVVDVEEVRLEPGEPPYAGSPWHVAGMKNERIVACGLYYTSIENLTPSTLQFRMAVTYPRGFTAGDTGATLRTWGLRDGDACHQHIGSRAVHSGLGIVFPNIYQHRQSPFSLADPTKSGWQRVVAFWLVDPEVEVLSTRVVPPQQREWVREAVDVGVDRRVPVEVVEQIVEGVEGVMDVEEAEGWRGEVGEEREAFREANDRYYFCIPFDVWNVPGALH
ncbi:hypothetical protein Hypma_013474 [Hypsizygus marmoreus]|uniref:DUF4246 domain-containing protein n=1 Tax=Hypsizygus marmoreus TaxID=39966 RepID=A0A369JBL2_HYPMA|nr:hypothetical protein Hypma_013474 [Hypsizygus marmoreus]